MPSIAAAATVDSAAPKDSLSSEELCLDLPAWFPQLNLNLTVSAELFVVHHGLFSVTNTTFMGLPGKLCQSPHGAASSVSSDMLGATSRERVIVVETSSER